MTYKSYPDQEEILEIGQEILDSKSPALGDSKELILEVLHLVLEHDCIAGKNERLLSRRRLQRLRVGYMIELQPLYVSQALNRMKQRR